MLYLMEKDSKKTVLISKLGGQVYNYRIAVCQHHPAMLFECYSQHPENNLLIVRKTTSWSRKDSYLMWLLHLNEDFDDDLLQEAMSLLGFE